MNSPNIIIEILPSGFVVDVNRMGLNGQNPQIDGYFDRLENIMNKINPEEAWKAKQTDPDMPMNLPNPNERIVFTNASDLLLFLSEELGLQDRPKPRKNG